MSDEEIYEKRDEVMVRAGAAQRFREMREAALEVEDIADMSSRVERAGRVGYLVEPLWPEDAYGVLGAEDKAGKTWAVVDLALSVVTGGKWLGEFESTQGRVLFYCGEGGARNIVRRVRAVAEHKRVPMGLLSGQLFVSEQAPELRSKEALEKMNEELLLHEPKLVLVDPLYLAARGGKGSDLYAMGDLLTDVQQLVQGYGAALMFTTHWNKTGTGTGAQRFTGVGPGAWGRVLGSGAVASRGREEDKSVVEVEWEFTGSEIPETQFSMIRTVWADDQSDLSSPLHYEVQVTETTPREFSDAAKRAVIRKDVLKLLERYPDSSGSFVRANVRGRYQLVRDEMDAMRQDGLITERKGGHNSILWSCSRADSAE